MAEVLYDPEKDNYWLSVGYHAVGKTYRSQTNALLTERWLACNVLKQARFATMMDKKPWHPVTVHITKNGEHLTTDII